MRSSLFRYGTILENLVGEIVGESDANQVFPAAFVKVDIRAARGFRGGIFRWTCCARRRE